MTLRLRLLGPFEIQTETGTLSRPGRKTCAILAYLAATEDVHDRRHLMEMFCQEASDPAGALRWHLSRIRRQLPGDILTIENQKVGIKQTAVTSDHLFFQRIMSQASRQSVTELQRAYALYRGEFLADLHLRNAPSFDLWLLGERSRFRQLYETGTQTLLRHIIQQQQFEEAKAVARNLLHTNSLLENVHLQLIWLYAHSGQRKSALKQFEQCQRLLWQELAVRPSPELQALHEAIQQNDPLPALDEAPPAAPEHVEMETAVPDFVGRREELSQIQSCWQKGGGVMLVEAIAGGGKTRLIREFRRQLPPNYRQIQGNCYESTRTMPYQPWLHILQAFISEQEADVLHALAPRWQQQLALILPEHFPQTEATANQQQLFQAIAYLLLNLQPAPSRLLILEDLQWADEASLQLFHFISQQRRQTAVPILIMGTFRTEEVAENEALSTLIYDLGREDSLQRLSLRPLNDIEVEQLIAILWPDLPVGFRTPHIRDMLIQATGGNPLFTSEILRELAAAAELPFTLPIPPSLHELIQRRLNRLPASGRQVLESVAVLDQPASFELVQQISGRSEEETLQALELGLRWRLLQTLADSQIDFSHDLMQRAVQQLLSPLRRQRLHRRTAVTLGQQRTPAATLAYHWHHAGDTAQEGHYAALAGEAAAAQFAHEEAAQYLQRAQQLLTDQDRKIEVMLALGNVWRLNGRWSDAEALYREATALAAGSKKEAEAKAAWGSFLAVRGEYEEAKIWLQQAQTAFELSGELAKQANVLDELGMIHWRQGALTQAAEEITQAQTLARQTGNLTIIGKATGNLGIVHWSLREYTTALQCLEERLAIAEKLGDRVAIGKAVGNIGLVYMEQGRYTLALTKAIEKYQLEKELDNQRSMGIALGNMGYAYLRCGAWQRALICHFRQFEIALALGDRWGITLAAANFSELFVAQGKHTEARPINERVIKLAQALSIPYYLCQFMYFGALIAQHEENLERAARLADEAWVLVQPLGRKEVQFELEILRLRLAVQQDQLKRDTAVTQLQTALQKWTEPDQQAILWDHLWQLDRSRTDWAQNAAKAYQALYTERPDFEYGVRYQTLTGTSLPEPPSLPDLPPELTDVKIDITAVLNALEQVIDDLNVPDDK